MKKYFIAFVLICLFVVTICFAGSQGYYKGGGTVASGGTGINETDSNLVGLWYFENNLNDSSGEGNTLTDIATVSYNSSSPPQGSYELSLERTNAEWADIDEDNMSPSTFPFRYSTGVIATCAFGGWWTPIDTALSGTAKLISFFGDIYLEARGGGNLRFRINGSNYDTVGSVLTLTTPVHIMVAEDGSGDWHLYINGSEVDDAVWPATDTGTRGADSANLYIGSYGADSWDGYIDEVFAFDGFPTNQATGSDYSSWADVASEIYSNGFQS